MEKKNLPKGWKIATLEKIGNIFNGNSINTQIKQQRYYNIKKGIPYIATKDIGFDTKIIYENGVKIPSKYIEFFKIAPKNSILICSEGGSAGRKFGIVNKDVTFVNKLVALAPNNMIYGKIVFYWYQTIYFQKQFNSKLTGLIQGISADKFKNLQIPLPPIAEQKCIVAKIEQLFTNLDSGITKLQQAQKNLKIYRQALLKNAFEGKLTAHWRKQNKNKLETAQQLLERIQKERVSDYKKKLQEWQQKKTGKKPIPPTKINFNNTGKDLPKDWVTIKLGEITESEKGKKPKRENNKKTAEFPIPYINIEAFEIGNINSWTNENYCRFCNEKDLLMVWDGARSGFVNKGVFGALGSTLMRINFPCIPNNYGFYFLKSIFLEINGKPKGTGIPHVNPDLLWNYNFPFPPLAEQKQIVEILEKKFSVMDKLEKIIKDSLQKTTALRQAILKKAFDGKLVLQNSTDEHAEKFLARIQKEKKKQKIKK